MYFTQLTIIKLHNNNMFKHIKLLQGGSDRYHGLHIIVAKSCQCRTVSEVSGPVLYHEYSCLSGTRTGPDFCGIYPHLHYPSVDFLDE